MGKNKNVESPQTILDDILTSCRCTEAEFPCMEIVNYARRKINSIQKSTANVIAKIVTDTMYNCTNTIPTVYLECVLDLIISKFREKHHKMRKIKQQLTNTYNFPIPTRKI